MNDSQLLQEYIRGSDDARLRRSVSAACDLLRGFHIRGWRRPCWGNSTTYPAEARMTGDGPKLKGSQRLAPCTPAGSYLAAFAGGYERWEIDTTCRVTANDTNLVIPLPGRSSITLRLVFPNAFAGSGLDTVEFSRDPGGMVTGFKICTSGLRGLGFERVKQ